MAERAASNDGFLGRGVDRGLKYCRQALTRDFSLREACDMCFGPWYVLYTVHPRNVVSMPKSVILYFRSNVCFNTSMSAVVGAVMSES